MNKKYKITLIYLIIIGLFLISPQTIFASNSTKGKAGNSFTACAKNICKDDFKITMDVDKYDQNAWKTSVVGQYEYTVSDRTVKVTVPQTALDQGAVYRVRIFYGKYGTVDNSDFFSLDELDDVDADDLDDGIKVVKTQIKKGGGAVNKNREAVNVSREANSNVLKIDVHSGYEAVVVAYLSKDVVTNKKCDGKKVTCINGKDTEIVNGSATLAGVSASEYVQNPKSSILVKNLRARGEEYGQACDNAYKGVYDSETAGKKSKSDDKKYTIPEGDTAALEKYRNYYYNPIIGDYYCNRSTVAFNLTSAQIAKLANRTLKLFYSSWKTSNSASDSSGSGTSSSGSSTSSGNTYDEINSYVNTLQSNPNVKTVTNTDISLQCENDLKEGTGSKEYLYVDKKDITTSKLSDGSTPVVCNTICYEHLTVTYDPPVASIAGLCFTYKVTVKSETKCGVKYNQDLIDGGPQTSGGSSSSGSGGLVGKLQKEMCSPVPICDKDSSHTQAGPSKDFDDCINDCDGGKYSQSCINKCYTKVYGNKQTTKSNNKKNSNIEKTTNDKEENSTTNLNLLTSEMKDTTSGVLKIADKHTWNESNLKGYFKQSSAVAKCNTKQKIRNNIDYCAEYFFEAKTLYPKGKYNNAGTKWKSDIAKSRNKINRNDVWDSIGRASPYYIRDKQSTKELILSIVDVDIHNGRPYFIDENGIKRQHVENGIGYACNEVCSFTGCSSKNALSPNAFVNGLNISENKDDGNSSSSSSSSSSDNDDMSKIEAAVEDCRVSSACETTETTSNFDIKIINPREENEKNEVEKSGSTMLGNITPSSENMICTDDGESDETPDPEDVFSMFVPAYENDNTKYGILGLCYDNTTSNPQYQTTITFPGSWINYKSRNIYYDGDCNDDAVLKGGYFCSAYDSTDVNVKWWKWRNQTKDTDGKVIYSTKQEPEINNNIQASAKNFGKYNWNINYSCFYGIWDGSTTPPPDDPKCEGDDCNKHPNQTYKFKIIDQGKLFTENSSQRQGYNWTSAAKIVAGITTGDADAETYSIDPEKYIEYLNQNENDERVYKETAEDDYYIYIPSEGIDYIKKNKNQKYTEYNGNFRQDPNVKGLLRYTSDVINDLSGKSGIVIKAGDNIRPQSNGRGTNNNYTNIGNLK